MIQKMKMMKMQKNGRMRTYLKKPANKRNPRNRQLLQRDKSSTVQFNEALSLGAEVDSWDARAQAVSLLTLHASKGLEFSVVFIVGCDEGLLPLALAGRLFRSQLRLFRDAP